MSAADQSQDVETLIAEFERSGLRELHVRTEGFELFLSKDADAAGLAAASVAGAVSVAAAPPVATPTAASAPAAPTSWPPGAIVIGAPYLGTFYRSPKPGADPYVEVGDTVAPESELCLVEVMKLFTSVRADAAGLVHAVLARDGDMVAPGQPLFVIVPG